MDANEDRLHGLMIKALAGDGRAYQALLKELSAYLRGFYRRRLTRLPDEVEDLVQETLLAVHNQRHTYQVGQPFTAWVHAIARYKLIDMLRRRTGREALNDPLDDESEIFSVSDTQAMEARRDLAKLLEQLPDRQRLPIQYVKLDGLSVMEAAGLANMSQSAVKIGVHRGMKALAALIKGKP
jgi:RNA polymerase sigma-70 factor (ECF subfamily)